MVCVTDSAQLSDVEVGVSSLEWIAGPLDKALSNLDDVFSLGEFELEAYAFRLVAPGHASDVRVMVSPAIVQGGDPEEDPDHPTTIVGAENQTAMMLSSDQQMRRNSTGNVLSPCALLDPYGLGVLFWPRKAHDPDHASDQPRIGFSLLLLRFCSSRHLSPLQSSCL